MSSWFRALFLFSSFGPLYLLLSVGLGVQRHAVAAIVAAIAFGLSLVIFERLRAGFKLKSPSRMQVDVSQALDENIIGYLIAYLPPFLLDDFSNLSKVSSAVIFYFVVVIMMFKSETLYVNPYFLVFGYRIFRVTLPSKRSAIVVTNKPEIAPKELLNLYEIQPSRLFYAD